MPRTRAKRRSRLALRHRNPYRKLSEEEIRLAEMWHNEDGMEPSEIGQLLRRDKSTITRLLVKRDLRKKDGRPQLLDVVAVDELIARLDHMIVVADGEYEVTVDQLRRHARVRASCRTISRALHARRIFFPEDARNTCFDICRHRGSEEVRETVQGQDRSLVDKVDRYAH